MENLYQKEPDSLQVSGELSEEQQLIEDDHCLRMLNTIFGAEVVEEYLEKEDTVNMPLFHSFREYLIWVKKQNKLETE